MFYTNDDFEENDVDYQVLLKCSFRVRKKTSKVIFKSNNRFKYNYLF